MIAVCHLTKQRRLSRLVKSIIAKNKNLS